MGNGFLGKTRLRICMADTPTVLPRATGSLDDDIIPEHGSAHCIGIAYCIHLGGAALYMLCAQ